MVSKLSLTGLSGGSISNCEGSLVAGVVCTYQRDREDWSRFNQPEISEYL